MPLGWQGGSEIKTRVKFGVRIGGLVFGSRGVDVQDICGHVALTVLVDVQGARHGTSFRAT